MSLSAIFYIAAAVAAGLDTLGIAFGPKLLSLAVTLIAIGLALSATHH